jgi:hypothetical protein
MLHDQDVFADKNVGAVSCRFRKTKITTLWHIDTRKCTYDAEVTPDKIDLILIDKLK